MTQPLAIWLNGVSSSGKTSLAKGLQASLTTPCLHLQVDTFINMLPAKVLMDIHAFRAVTSQTIVGFHEAVLALLKSGNSVIVDHVFEKPEWLAHCLSIFEGQPVFFVGVHCSESILAQREEARGDRKIGLAKAQLGVVHQNREYDFEVDTSEIETEHCVASIEKALVNRPDPSAFERMRAQRKALKAHKERTPKA